MGFYEENYMLENGRNDESAILKLELEMYGWSRAMVISRLA